jgi:hypothetical protein
LLGSFIAWALVFLVDLQDIKLKATKSVINIFIVKCKKKGGHVPLDLK